MADIKNFFRFIKDKRGIPHTEGLIGKLGESEIKVEHYVDKQWWQYEDPGFEGKITPIFSRVIFFYCNVGLFNEKESKKIISVGKKLITSLKTEIKKHPDYRVDFNRLKVLFQACGISDVEREVLITSHIGDRYNYLNSREYIRKINSIENPEEKRKTIEKIGDQIKAIFTQKPNKI